jgi:hypothetical protein
MYYDHAERNLFLVGHQAGNPYSTTASYGMWVYNFNSQSWGRIEPVPALFDNQWVCCVAGDSRAIARHYSLNISQPVLWRLEQVDALQLYYPKDAAASTGASYVQTSLDGFVDGKSNFNRVTPILKSRVNAASGTPAASLEFKTFTERHDTTAASTTSVTESTQRKRFDFLKTDNFGRAKVTFTDMVVDVDDIAISKTPAGKD